LVAGGWKKGLTSRSARQVFFFFCYAIGTSALGDEHLGETAQTARRAVAGGSISYRLGLFAHNVGVFLLLNNAGSDPIFA
jgi:hypothetical protein